MNEFEALRIQLTKSLYQRHFSLDEKYLREHWQEYSALWLRLFAISPYPIDQRPTNEDEFVKLWLKVDTILKERFARMNELAEALFSE